MWKFGRLDLVFRLPCISKIVQDGNRFGNQRHDHVPNTSQWSKHRSAAGFQNSAKGAKTRSAESFQPCHKMRQVQPSDGPLQRSPAPTPGHAGNTRATCRGIVDNASASPAAHKRMTGKSLLDVFGGSGFLTKAIHHLGLLGYLLDTNFSLRYDVTQSFVLTRIRRVSARKCVAGLISPPCGFSDLHAETWAGICAPYFSQVCCDRRALQCCRSKARSFNNFRTTFRALAHHVTKAALPSCLALAMLLATKARRFQRTRPFRGMGDDSLVASKDVAMGVIGLAPNGNQIQ